MELVEYLNWDSQFFGISIGRTRIDISHLQPKSLDMAINEARALDIKCLYVEIPFGIPEVIAYCSENGFFLVDLKTTLEKKIGIKDTRASSINITYKLEDEYYTSLREIVKQISIQSRFSYDLKFGRENSRLLYEEWLRVSFYEKYCDYFIVYIKDEKPAGFITVKIKNGRPFIDLLGVLDEERGKGIGKCLINEAERRLSEARYNTMKVVTQGHNIGALRTYQSMNFKIESINIFYHKWID
jgi:dTDP-4-amino-4,6-dideoxy-D-galactose acyltransferase